jgi:lysozyme
MNDIQQLATKKGIKYLSLVLSILFLFTISNGQNDNFNNRPWQNEKYPLIIDPYAPNEVDFEKLITDRRVAGIIHQASRGLTHKDDKYKERAATAKQKGLLYASYHLGTNTDPIKQADFYLSVIGENKSQPMALDIEDIGGNNINLPDAEKFIKRIFEKTGKYPLVYVNHKVFTEISAKYDKNSIFAKCKLWYARFINSIPPLSKKVWEKVTFWQFASEINCRKTPTEYAPNCPYKIAGTKNDIDINVFNGTIDELKRFWIE